MEMNVLLIFRINAQNHNHHHNMASTCHTSSPRHNRHSEGYRVKVRIYRIFTQIYIWGNGFESKRNLFIVVKKRKMCFISYVPFLIFTCANKIGAHPFYYKYTHTNTFGLYVKHLNFSPTVIRVRLHYFSICYYFTQFPMWFSRRSTLIDSDTDFFMFSTTAFNVVDPS